MNWYVYIAKAKSGKYYTGITPNPEKRIQKHNSGKGAQMSEQHGSFSLIYVSGTFPDRSHAQTREFQIKGWSREKKEKLVKGVWK